MFLSKMTAESALQIIHNTPNEVRERLQITITNAPNKSLSAIFAELTSITERLEQTKRAYIFLRNSDRFYKDN